MGDWNVRGEIGISIRTVSFVTVVRGPGDVGPGSKKCRQPLEAGKDKEAEASLEQRLPTFQTSRTTSVLGPQAGDRCSRASRG